MVGNIGALRTLPVAPVDRAVEYALALISGWTKKDREPFQAALEDLRESAAHNAEVYEQASAALKELSARGKEARDLATYAQEAHDAAVGLARLTEKETTDAWATLTTEQAAHRDQVDSFHQSADARHRDLVKSETAVMVREDNLAKNEAEVVRRVQETEKLAQTAAAVRSQYLAKAAEIAAIINRKD